MTDFERGPTLDGQRHRGEEAVCLSVSLYFLTKPLVLRSVQKCRSSEHRIRLIVHGREGGEKDSAGVPAGMQHNLREGRKERA